MTTYNQEDLATLPSRFRGMLLNCFTAPKPTFLVGTRNEVGQSNLAIFTQVFHIGANPFAIGMLFRPDVVERHTLRNIESTGIYTLSAVSRKIVPHAHQTSAKYPAGQSEFEAVGLGEYYRDGFDAPAVTGSPLMMGLRFAEKHDITFNNTILVIGAVEWVSFEGQVSENGFWDASAHELVASGGLDSYYDLGAPTRYPYATVESWPSASDKQS